MGIAAFIIGLILLTADGFPADRSRFVGQRTLIPAALTHVHPGSGLTEKTARSVPFFAGFLPDGSGFFRSFMV